MAMGFSRARVDISVALLFWSISSSVQFLVQGVQPAFVGLMIDDPLLVVIGNRRTILLRG